jgi:predicted Zn finger-like uncharacterized protein
VLVNCPNCETHFNVPDDMIPEAGRKVRCTQCKHVWHQMHNGAAVELPKPADEDDTVSPKEEDSPTKVKTSKVGTTKSTNAKPIASTPTTTLVLIALLATLIASILSILSNHKYLKGFTPFYESIGLHNTDNLVFSKFDVKKIFEDGKVKFLVDAEITNESSYNLRLPDLKLVAFTVGGRTMQKETIPSPRHTLHPGETITYNENITSSAKADRIVLDIGSSWELMLR